MNKDPKQIRGIKGSKSDSTLGDQQLNRSMTAGVGSAQDDENLNDRKKDKKGKKDKKSKKSKKSKKEEKKGKERGRSKLSKVN
jgi:hypothetical protein